MWQFEGEDLLQDDPNIMDFLMGVEDVFTEGALGCNQHPSPTPASIHYFYFFFAVRHDVAGAGLHQCFATSRESLQPDPEYRGPLFSISTVLQKQDRCEWK